MNEACWTLLGVVVGVLSSGGINYLLQRNQFKFNKEIYFLQNQSSEVVKSLLTEMLNHKSYTDRSFEALKRPIGGYTEDEVRQLLHEIKAKKVMRNDNTEWWYLLSREDERLKLRSEKKA
ncbi:hypothetical protein KKA87_00235 [bacterium]|nr:hypothetical protein [bacterium]